MKVTLKIDDKAVQKMLKKMPEVAYKETGKTVDAIGDKLRNTAIEGIRSTSKRSGNTYKRRKQKGDYIEVTGARAGGKEYPQGFTGNLDLNIRKYIDNTLNVRVVSEAIYSARLEYEYNIPFMKMTIDLNEKYISDAVQKLADRVLIISGAK